MPQQNITIPAKDGGSFKAYLSGPGHAAPAIVVLQEVFGVNDVMRSITDSFAKQGYLAICPDLFWRQQPGVQLTDKTQEEWDRAFELMNGFDPGAGVRDIAATIDHARNLPDTTGKVGAVGYCLGGMLAYLTACRTDVDASVGYYGVNIHTLLDEADKITKPLMLHIAGRDQFVDKDAQKEMHAGLDDHPMVTLHDYPDQDHAFARTGGRHYDKKAAETANRRTAEFFEKHLKSGD